MAIHTLSIDVETFSDVDLKKCGVYKYAESPDFEILLFGVSVDGSEVTVYDLASGDTVPEEIIRALSDDSVIKWAYNASFERVCLSVWLRRNYPQYFSSYSIEEDTVRNYLDPSSWRCSLVWGAYMGLPLSLEGIGKVLKLENQKMAEGKALIRYFCVPCKPTKANGGRTRNLPEHDPVKWSTFIAYNKRDVKTEMAIQKKLSKFPAPDFLWEEYHLDQEINDRGIRVDPVLVAHAIECDEQYREKTTKRAYELTGLANPNSPAQLKEWLEEQGTEVDTLDKKAVRALLPDAEGDVLEVLKLRLLMAKTSVKKYEAIRRSVCADGRVHGLLQFYGANRTGRWCLTGDHEVLTDRGWQRLDAWKGGRIACWHPSGETVSFQASKSLAFPYCGDMYAYTDKRIAQISTPDHRMYCKKRYEGEWCIDTVEHMAQRRPCIPFTGYRKGGGSMDQANLRVLVMVQADGHYTADGDLRLAFSKQRKIDRCKSLLRAAAIQHCVRTYPDRVVFTIYSRHLPMWLRMFQEKTFGPWLLEESADVFFDELACWDGYRSGPNSVQYTTCNRQNADMVQALAHITGRCAQIKVRHREQDHPHWKDAYVVDIWLKPVNCHEIRQKPVVERFAGTVYCAETPTGFFLVRRNGRVWITGNSGRLVQVQNLPQNHLPDLALARELVKTGRYEELDMLYESTPNVLSELIRTAFVPRPGCRFIVADFSAIEARVIAWLSGEQWRLEVFRQGGDIYCASASKMFHVPVEKHGQNAHLRQKGKIAELALGYGGAVGALTAMGALEMGLLEEELPPLVRQWREANPHIIRLWAQVENAAMTAVRERTEVALGRLVFQYQSGMLFIALPSGRKLCYVKPRIQTNRFGGDGLTYEGVGEGKKWTRIETFGGTRPAGRGHAAPARRGFRDRHARP